MDLIKSGKLIRNLRKSRGMTQKEIADILNIEPKTVSKWETGRGFPDVSYVSELADIFGVSEKILLSGDLIKNTEEVGNMKKIKFYVCPHCGSIIWGTGEYEVVCCGKKLDALQPQNPTGEHNVKISEIENDFYIEFGHEMNKEHFISFVAYVTFDRVLAVRLYPEQDSAVRFPKMYGGKLYYYCGKHGLFVCDTKKKSDGNVKTNLTALMSAFARAYHFQNSQTPIFKDTFAEKMFSAEEYNRIRQYIRTSGKNTKEYVNTRLAPTPVARAAFCEDTLKTAVKTGTEQYVILGSGLDTFALRNDYGISVFEIDTTAVIEDKTARIKRAGLEIPDSVHYIPTDLTETDLEKILKDNEFDTGKKTFFSCMGLLYYLTKDEISNIFEKISQFAADGSTVVFDFADNHFFSSEIPRVKELIDTAAASGMPMKTCFGYGELEMLLQKHGFLIYEFLNDKDIQNEYFCGHDEISAFEHINYASVVLKK